MSLGISLFHNLTPEYVTHFDDLCNAPHYPNLFSTPRCYLGYKLNFLLGPIAAITSFQIMVTVMLVMTQPMYLTHICNQRTQNNLLHTNMNFQIRALNEVPGHSRTFWPNFKKSRTFQDNISNPGHSRIFQDSGNHVLRHDYFFISNSLISNSTEILQKKISNWVLTFECYWATFLQFYSDFGQKWPKIHTTAKLVEN